MPRIPRSFHGVLDYLSALILLLLPVVLGVQDPPTQAISFAFGGGALIYSVFTDYELALLRVIPFPIHRALDLVWGVGLGFAPIHFGVKGVPAVIFAALGLLGIVAAIFTTGNFSKEGRNKPIVPGA